MLAFLILYAKISHFARKATSITIPNSVNFIGDEAFSSCSSLTSINVHSGNEAYRSVNGVLFNENKTELIKYPEGKTGMSYSIPNSVTSIGDSAFSNCTFLSSITIPNSVTSIGTGAFAGCTALTSITIPDSVISLGEGGTFSGCTSLASITMSNNLTFISEAAFQNCSSLISIEIPDSVSSIGTAAFIDCTSLVSVTIPSSVTSIGLVAFLRCTSLESVIISEGVTSLGDNAFQDCISLESVTIPSSMASISDLAFLGCTSLSSVTIQNGVTSIGAMAFYGCTSLASITIPSSVASIDTMAFYGCTSLASVSIPGSVASVGENAFQNCTFLSFLIIQPGVTSIGNTAFRNCTSLISVFLPLSMTEIGSSAFEDCTSLTSITIPSSVTSIGSMAFFNCTSLRSITIPNSVASIGGSAFWRCNDLTIYGYAGSYAQTYAEDNYIPFVPIGSAASVPQSNAVQGTNSADTYTVENTIPGNMYVFLSVKSDSAEDLLAEDNLLYIDQMTADGYSLTFTYQNKDSYSGSTQLVFGQTYTDIPIDETTFPDSVWRNYVSTNFDTDSDGNLSIQEVYAVTDIDVKDMGISDLTGIAYFINLTTLDCYNNNISNLNVRNNFALTTLDCGNNQLTTLNVSKNTELYILACRRNQLTSLDISKNTKLGSLDCGYNQISKLDISNQTELMELVCHDNNIKALDISKNTDLMLIACGQNPISSLDFSHNTELAILSCASNQLATLDLSANPNITLIAVQDQVPLLSLQYENGTYFVDLPGPNYSPSLISSLYDGTATATGVVFESLEDVPDTLTYFYDTQKVGETLLMNVTATIDKETLDSGRIAIDATNFPDPIFREYVSENFDTNNSGYLSTQEAAAVTSIEVLLMSITDLTGIEYFTNLEYLNCMGNLLTELNVSQNTALVDLSCSLNRLTALDVSSNTALLYLSCDVNYLTSLDISGNTALTDLNCDYNYLASLDVSNNNLYTLSCRGNLLTELDLSNNATLYSLYCTSNYLTGLDLSSLTNLYELYCSDNRLTELDLSNCAFLSELRCENNRLSALNLNANVYNLWTILADPQYPDYIITEINGEYYFEITDSSYSPSKVSNLSAGTASATGIKFDSLNDVPDTFTYSYETDWANGSGAIEVIVSNEGKVEINAQNFPDSVWRTYVNRYDADSDGFLSLQEQSAVTGVYVPNSGITDLAGIEFFPNLQELYCHDNALAALDISGNTKITFLICQNNQLTALDISNNTSLEFLFCQNNQLTALDTCSNTNLQILACSQNQISSLDLSNNPNLFVLLCEGNAFSTLDVGTNENLSMFVTDDQTPTLDLQYENGTYFIELTGPNYSPSRVSNLSAGTASTEGIYFDSLMEVPATITYLYDLDWVYGTVTLAVTATINNEFETGDKTAIDEINFPDSAFRSYVLANFDVNNDGYLSGLEAEAVTEIIIEEMGISDLTGITYFKNLHTLNCSYNNLTSLDLSGNTALVRFACMVNQLTSLDISGLPDLEILVAAENNLTALDTGNNPALQTLIVAINQLTSLDVSNNTELTMLVISNNNITSVDVSNNPKLTSLHCGFNPLTSLVLSNNTLLNDLHCESAQLTTLDLANQTALTSLYCSDNKLATIDLNANIDLTFISANNQTPTVDLQYENGEFFVALPGPNYSPARISSLSAGTATATGISFASLQDVPETLTYLYDTDWARQTLAIEVTLTINKNAV
jgi:Leucine-rich repeat (LRR) protein